MKSIELIKETSSIVKSFAEVMANFLQNPLDSAILDGHKQLIKNVVDGNPVSPDAIDFLCAYKDIVKQHKRKTDLVQKATEFLEEYAEPQKIEVDWLEFFFEKAKLIANEDMQLIWAKILAEEANEPGKISMSLLHTLSVMRYDQAEFFCNISRFALRSYRSNDVTLLLFVATNRAAYENSRITPKRLKELERLGLIECDFNSEYVFKDTYNDITKKRFISGSHTMTVWGDPQNGGKIKAGNVQFTEDGRALYDIIDSNYKKYRNSIFEFTARKLTRRNCRVHVDGKEF